jgi:hypothetical protein
VARGRNALPLIPFFRLIIATGTEQRDSGGLLVLFVPPTVSHHHGIALGAPRVRARVIRVIIVEEAPTGAIRKMPANKRRIAQTMFATLNCFCLVVHISIQTKHTGLKSEAT